MNIRNLAKSIIKKYNSRNPFDIAIETGTILVFAPLTDVRGFYQYFQRNSIMYIDESLGSHEQKLVCAHELGHMLLHRKINTIYMDTKTFFNTDKHEQEANLFAVELLIPDEVILENWNLTTGQLSRLLGYEELLVEMRLDSYRKL